MRYTTIDQAHDYGHQPPATEFLSDRIRAIDLKALQLDCGDLLLCDLPVSYLTLRDLLADAQQELEEHPIESSAFFYACAGLITRALLGSLETNLNR